MNSDQHKLFLNFKDSNLEGQFKEAQNGILKISLRHGLIISMVIWASVIPLLFYVIPESFNHVALVISLVVFPYFLLLLFTTYNDKFRRFYLLFSASTNVLAGLLVIFVTYFIPNGVFILLTSLVFLVFFGFYMYQLRLLMGSITVLIYLLVFQYNLLYTFDVSDSDLALLTFVCWLTFLFAIVAGYLSEKNERKIFLYQKTIEDKNILIAEEKQKSDDLLLNILPEHIVNKLKLNPTTIADHHQTSTVMFADIVGFTKLSQELSATDLVILLNQIFSEFDNMTVELGLEKIKTIGDAYMVAGGLENDPNESEKIAILALKMLKYINNTQNLKDHNLQIRIGIHTGPVVAGVIGLRKFTYDLWGDTVNTASRMESHGESGKITVSENINIELQDKFRFVKRPLIVVKGKGEMQTYFLSDT